VSGRQVGWGVLGAAAINDALIPGLQGASNATLHAIASRRPGVAAAEAERWGAPVAHDSYEALLADDAVEAVYIPVSNALHAEWTVRALEAGKHVLCEKPLGLSEEEVQRIGQAADKAGRLALEAFMYRFAPRWQRARQILAEGLIGDPRVVRVGFAFKQDPPGYNIRFDPAAGGGIVWDMGCYATNMARDLFGAEPHSVVATGHAREGADVETTVEAILRFPGGRSAVTHVSFDYANPYSQVEVVGTDGWIAMPGTGMRREPFTRLLMHRMGDEVFADGVEPVVEEFPYTDTYRLEVEHLSDCIITGRRPRYGLDDALANVRVLTAIFRSLEEGRVVPVG
jgi:xylose dehydrogenase (NAD/NADP)